MPVIAVHTHLLNREWRELLRRHGKPRFELRRSMAVRGGNAQRVFKL